LFLFYADGKQQFGNVCGVAPAFKCSFGGGEGIPGCQKKVQTYLDGYYKDFNLIFTLTKPTSGVYQTAVITDGGGTYCGQPSGVLGVAGAACALSSSAASYTFYCTDPRKCAVTIAQEHAHTVGLMHTSSDKDLLTPAYPCSCPGFEDKSNSTVSSPCGPTQNSYQLMKSRLGAWPGGDKPSPFGGSSGGSGGGGAGGSGGTGGSGGSGSGGAGGAGGGSGAAGAGGGDSGGGAGGDPGQGGAGGEGDPLDGATPDVAGGCAVVGGGGAGYAVAALLAAMLAWAARRRR